VIAPSLTAEDLLSSGDSPRQPNIRLKLLLPDDWDASEQIAI